MKNRTHFDTEHHSDSDHGTFAKVRKGPDNTAPDDTLTHYLQEMGSIPMLTREEELELVTRLDRARERYRHAAFTNAWVLRQVAETFDHIHAGELSLDRNIDTVPSLARTAEEIRPRLARNVGRLRRLLDQVSEDFTQRQQARTVAQRTARLRPLRRRIRQAARLAVKLSPRMELVESWVQALKDHHAKMNLLAERLDQPARSASQRAERGQVVKELRQLILEVGSTPEDLAGLLNVLPRRRAVYHHARQELAQANLRLVVAVAKKYRGRGLPFADLIQEGNAGLMRGVDKFDYRLGYKFGTYATWWIRQGVTRALSEISRTVRLPGHLLSVLRDIEQTRGDLALKNGREPSIEEVAKKIRKPVPEVRAILAVGRPPISLDEPVSPEEDGLQAILTDPGATYPTEEVDSNLLRDRIGEVLQTLVPRDRQVIELRFGLRDGVPRSLDEVSRVFGVTRERIRQIEMRALLKLREPERRDQLADFAGPM